MDKLDYFFQKYGGLTIVITRFMPFFRTFAPFIAGMGHMNFSKFTLFNTIGGVAWVSFFVLVGLLLWWCTLCSRTLRGHRIGHRCRFGEAPAFIAAIKTALSSRKAKKEKA